MKTNGLPNAQRFTFRFLFLEQQQLVFVCLFVYFLSTSQFISISLSGVPSKRKRVCNGFLLLFCFVVGVVHVDHRSYILNLLHLYRFLHIAFYVCAHVPTSHFIFFVFSFTNVYNFFFPFVVPFKSHLLFVFMKSTQLRIE